MEFKFEVGDVVKLKSGGPKMTVKEYQEKHSIVPIKDQETEYTGYILCSWFDEKNKLRCHRFLEKALETSL